MAINFLNNGIFAGDVTIPEYIYHTGNTSQDRFGFAGNDTFVIRTNGTDKFTADANSAILLEAGITKLQTTSTGISISGQATGTFSGDISTSGNGQTNTPFRLGADYNSYMVAVAGNTWGLFWAGNSGARYGTNGNGGPGNIWGNSSNPNEFAFVGSDSTAWTVYGSNGNVWQKGDLWVNGGDIVLGGTGRIQGIDTVSAGTDAANKTYVDNAISGVPQGTITGGGQNLRLALWDGSSSIGSDSDFTYNSDTLFARNLTVTNQINTNSANLELNYQNGDGTTTSFKNLDIRNGKNAIIASFNGASKLTTLQGDLTVNGDDLRLGAVMLQDSGAGRLGFNRDTSTGAIHDSGYNAFQIQVAAAGASGKLEVQEYNGAGSYAGSTLITGSGITINDYVTHNGDADTRFGFAAANTFQIDTGNSLRFDVNNSGMKLGNANARVTTILDQDNMSSNSATALATQQSIKQYVDTAITTVGTVTGTGVSGRVAFWNGTSSIASSSNLYWDNGTAELGIGTSSPTTSFTIASGHGTTRANLFYNGGGTGSNNAFIDMWASEPGVSYNGSGIGSNIVGSPYYGRKTTTQGQTYIRFINGQFEVYTGPNSSGTSSTAVRRFYIENNGLATFSSTPAVGTRSAGDNTNRAASTAFVTTAIGNVSTGVQSVSDDGGSTINVSGSATARVVAAVTGAVSSSSANLATGAQIQTAINTAISTIPSGLAFEGNWDASTGNPPSSSPSNGQFWIVTVAGSTSLSGITDWKVGDWAIYVEQGAGTDAWQKVDNTSTLSGDGAANQLTYWTSTSNVAGDTGLTYNASTNKLTVTGDLSAKGYNIFGLGLSTGTWYGDLGSNGYTRETGLQMTSGSEFVVLSKNGQGSTLVDGAYLAYESANGFFGSYNSSYGNLTGIQATAANTLTVKQLDGGTANLAITSIANATSDTDKFLVSDSGVVKYRTGAQVLSDIGAQASGNYLPVANPTFTGTLTGPTIRATSALSVDGAMLAGNTFSDPDLVLTVLDTDTTQSIRDKITDTSSITKVSDSTAPAPGVFAVNGSSYPQGFGPFYTIDEGDTFTFEFWVKKESGAATSALLYAGSNFYNSSGTYLGNSMRYWGESGLQVAGFSDWYHVSGTLGPARGSSTGEIPTTAVSMRLLFLFNYNANGSIVTHYCGLKVYKSGKTVTQLYRKTLGSEANTGRNRDLVVDQNGDLYGTNLTITGNLIGNTSNTTELGTYSTGAIKRIRMCQGGELHFGDTTTSAPLGITEGSWNDFGDNDRLSIYGRSSITFYAGSTAAALAATLGSTGLTLNTITNATSDTDKFLVSDSGVIKYRTGAQVLSDIGAASSGSLGNYLPLAGGTMSGTINSTATTALQMDGAAAAQGILMRADSSGTYPVFLREQNPASGGETSAWLFKDEVSPWGIWHNNPNDSFDWTRAGNNLGIANNVGGETNSVMIRLRSADGTGTFAGNVIAPSFTGRLQGAVTGAPDATIWCVSGQYPDWGIFYNEGSPDLIEFKSSGNVKATISLDNGDYTGRNATFEGDITSKGLTVDYTGNRTGDAGILVTNDADDWGIKVDKDGTADYGILSQTDGENAIVVRNAAGTNKIQLQGDGDATFAGDVTINGSHLKVLNHSGAYEGASTDYLYIGGSGLDSSDAAIYLGNAGNNTGYGWRFFYEGSGSGNLNRLIIKSENAGSGVDALGFTQDGNATFGGDVGIGIAPTKELQVNGEALFGNGTDGLLLSYSGGNSSGIIDTGHSSTALEFRVGNTQELLINSTSATFAGNLTVNGASATFNPDADSSLSISNAGTDAVAVFAGTGDVLYLGGNNTTGMYLDQSANAVFSGNLYIPSYIYHSGDPGGDTYFGFNGNDNFSVVTAGGYGLVIDSNRNVAFSGDVTMTQSSGNNILFINSSAGGNPVIYMQDTTRKWGQFVAAGDLYFKDETSNIVSLRLDGGNGNAIFAGDVNVGDELTITTINNATADPDKFLCASGGNKVGYRTGAQVLADIGAAPASGGSYVSSVATGGGLDGGTITTTGTIEVEYDGVPTNIMQSGFDYTSSSIVANDYIMVTMPGNTQTYRRIGYTKVGNLPFASSSVVSGVTSVATGSGISGGTITSTGTIQVDSTVIRNTGTQTITGNTSFAPSSTSTSYSNAAIELRESNQSGSSGTPPRISWHHGGVVASSMTIEANGTIAVRNNPGNAYEKFACGDLYAKNGTFVLGTGGTGDLWIGNQGTGKNFRFHTNNNQTYFDMNCSTINWREGSSTRYYFYPSTANMTINGTLTQNSDARVKENVVEIDNCISKVQAMKGVYYNRTDFNTDVTKVGVIAQDVEAVLPELILEAPDTKLKSVAYAELTAVLINAIKEQQEIIEDLKTRVQQLEK